MATKKVDLNLKKVKPVKKTTIKNKKTITTEPIAVISLSSHQYLVKPGDIFEVEKLNLKDKEIITCSEVLLYTDQKQTLVGTPFVEGVKTELEHLNTNKDKKITISRYKAKSRYRKVKGHRQTKTRLKVNSITKIN